MSDLPEFWCGCCGNEIAETEDWCERCKPHLAPARVLDQWVEPWNRTHYAQHGKPCPYELWGVDSP